MKDITIPFRSSFKVHAEKDTETKVFSSTEFELHRKIRKRGQAIIQSGLDIEEYVKELIAKLLFKDLDDADFLVGVLLDSSDCTFSAKRRILQSCLVHFNVLSRKERNQVDQNLSKVMKYRNAFAHGKISTNEPFSIEYFEGQKQNKELTDEYWDTLVEYLENTFKLLNKLEQEIFDKK